MNSVDQAIATQLKNIQTRTGQSLDELAALIHTSGLTKHGAIRDLFKRDLGLGYGDANALAHYVLKSAPPDATPAPAATRDEFVNALYTGAKADLRPIHDAVLEAVATFGPFELAPKKRTSACVARSSSRCLVRQRRCALRSV